MTNLLKNSLYHGRDGKSLKISLSDKGEIYELAFQDQGKGIEARELPYVFDRLYKGDYARKSSNGSGLGLFIAKELTEKHKGALEVESIPWQNTAFRLSLPKLHVFFLQ